MRYFYDERYTLPLATLLYLWAALHYVPVYCCLRNPSLASQQLRVPRMSCQCTVHRLQFL